MVADTRGELGRRLSRGAIVAIVIACVGLLLGAGAIITLRSLDKPAQLLTLDQLHGLSLQGTWRDKAGAEIQFGPGNLTYPLNDSTGGSFTFANVPNIFDHRNVQNPPSNGHGYWTIDGQTAGTVFFTFQGGGWAAGSAPQVTLLVEGSPSAPTLLCRYPDNSDSCTFTKQ